MLGRETYLFDAEARSNMSLRTLLLVVGKDWLQVSLFEGLGHSKLLKRVCDGGFLKTTCVAGMESPAGIKSVVAGLS